MLRKEAKIFCPVKRQNFFFHAHESGKIIYCALDGSLARTCWCLFGKMNMPVLKTATTISSFGMDK